MRTNRRRFFERVGQGAAGLTLGVTATPSAFQTRARASKGDEDGPVLLIGDDIAVAETSSGKVRGYVLRGIYHFLGLPYGADTAGPNRFMPPQKPKPWNDVFPALWWGNSAPQNMENRYANKYVAFRDHWNYDDVSEDCLRINVFTPALKDGRKRPVLFWIHGGGFTNGNGIEQDGYNGENFARAGDIVFCSINHRLGPLGYCNLAGVGGEKYAASGNAGMLDIVAALEWVRDNIANFGGDPGSVTIMGQSGGGAKVCVLTAMPSAQGLFHKAVVLSGASVRSGDKGHAEKLGSYVLAEAGLTASEIGKLHDMPWKTYYEVATRAQRKLAAELAAAGNAPPGLRAGFGPSVDGTILLQHPYAPEAAPTAATVPMMICSTVNEQAPAWTDAALVNVTLPQVAERLKERAGFGAGLGERARGVVDAYARVFPDKRPVEIWSLVSSNRQNVVSLADAKARQPAPVFVSWFAWQPPLFDGRIGAFHCVDICFWFHNTDLMLTHTGGGARPRKLAEKMAGSLVQFMKTGNPNGAGLTPWPKYTSEKGETLVLDDVCEVRNDPDREARRALPTT
jgi:para-nitrobenzyl esterase